MSYNFVLQSDRTNTVLKCIHNILYCLDIINPANNVQCVAHESFIGLHLPLINTDFRCHNSWAAVDGNANVCEFN
jgi:hypothetical protein